MKPTSELGAAPTLSQQVSQLEDEAERLRNICGGIIATLRINVGRGTLRCDSPETFNEVINQWAAAIGNIEQPAEFSSALQPPDRIYLSRGRSLKSWEWDGCWNLRPFPEGFESVEYVRTVPNG